MKKTILNQAHRRHGARLVEFGGFEMPVQYDSIVSEHHQVRNQAGLFDLCHMGRVEIRGERAVEAIDHVITNHAAKLAVGDIRYSLVLNEEGGVRDDILVYRLEDCYWFVVNAGNRDKLIAWFGEKLVQPGAKLEDRSEELAMIAVQGPAAESILAPLSETTWVPELSQLGYYKITAGRVTIGGESWRGWISRTGYTGEDGFELYVPSSEVEALWEALLEHSDSDRLKPCGLGARDTLRLEAGMPLYGHELSETINPLEAGLRFAVKLKKPNGFIGADALRQVADQGPERKLRAYSVDGKRVARDGMRVLAGDEAVGVVTSGAPSPTLGKNIAVALVRADLEDNAALEVEIRKHRAALVPHEYPFYKRS